jgi:hypothetical protein
MECGTMSWSLGWSRSWWRRLNAVLGAGLRPASNEPAEPQASDDWEAMLVEYGVPSDGASRIVPELVSVYSELGRGSAAALIRGAAAAFEAQAVLQAHVERNLRDVREVERLLGAFSGELEKLDEVLEVLSAYAQRMRAKRSKTPPHTLH